MSKFALYCEEPPGCICERCLYHHSSRCPHGSCYDDLRAKINPYDKAHPDKPPRKSWSNWKEDQAYWCRGGMFYQEYECDSFVEYDRSKLVVRDCLDAVIGIFQDGYISCSIIDSVGCEECMKRLEEKQERKEEKELAKKEKSYVPCWYFKGSSGPKVTNKPEIRCEDGKRIFTLSFKDEESFSKKFNECNSNKENCRAFCFNELEKAGQNPTSEWSTEDLKLAYRELINIENINTCATCEYSQDYGESVEYIKCEEGKRAKDVKKTYSCANYLPVQDIVDDEPEGDLEEQLKKLLEEGDRQDKISRLNTLNSGIEKGKLTPKEYLGGIKEVVKQEQCATYSNEIEGGCLPPKEDCKRYIKSEQGQEQIYIYRGLV